MGAQAYFPLFVSVRPSIFLPLLEKNYQSAQIEKPPFTDGLSYENFLINLQSNTKYSGAIHFNIRTKYFSY